MEQPLKDPSRFRQASRNTQTEVNYRKAMDRYIQESVGTYYEKLENFPKYTSRQTLARFLALYEIFKKVLNVQGDIIECGVNWGGGLMAFALMSTTLEPINFQRRIIGFDTFTGFTPPTGPDKKSIAGVELMREGELTADSFEDLQRCIELYDANRFIEHIPKVSLVKGDACQTIPTYLDENPQTVVSLLHLDFDLYEPTKVALEQFAPRMPKGAVIVFDELNHRVWPGETVAVFETLGIRHLQIKRFPFEPHISYAVLD
jgi:hypothetical protein